MIELMFPDYADVLQINVLDEQKREQVHPTIATAIDSVGSVDLVFMAPNFYHEGWSGIVDDKPKCRCGKEIQ